MDFGWSSEQEELRRLARSFGEKEIAPHVAEYDREERFPREIVESAGRLGLAGGEPMLRKDLADIIGLAKGRGMVVTVNSNLTLYRKRPYRDRLASRATRSRAKSSPAW